MATVTGNLNLQATITQINTSALSGAQSLSPALNPIINFTTSGTAASQLDLEHAKAYSLAATPTTIDLTSLLDVFGGAVNFARGKIVIVQNTATTDGYNVTLSGGASNAWSNFITGNVILPPSGFIVVAGPLATGWVVDGTHKTFKMDPGANTITVNVIIAGCSA